MLRLLPIVALNLLLLAGCGAKKDVVDRDRALVETLVRDGGQTEPLTGDLAAGARALRDGELDDAKSLLDRHAAKHPESAMAQYHLGLWAVESGQPHQAQDYFLRAIELNPDLHAALCHLGALYLQNGEDVAALKALERARALAPDDVRILANLGAARLRRGLWSEAVDAYKAALQVAPGHGSLLYDYAIALMERYQWQPALDALEQALTVRPYFAQAWAAKIVCLQGLGQLDAAEAAAVQALDSVPHPAPELHIAYARVMVAKRKVDKGMDQLREAVAADPNHAGAQLALGELADAAGAKPTAVDMYRKFLKNPRRNADDSRRIRDRLKQLETGKTE